MANPALGTKRHCQSCGANYYDLNKSPIICPHCEAPFDPEVLLKSRKSKPVVAASPKKADAVEEDVITDDLSAGIEGDEAENTNDDDMLDDSEDLGMIATSDDSDDEIVTSDEAIEDELDAPIADDE